MSSYREQFFEWVDKQPLYQAMNLQAKEMALHLVDCWLNNNYAYLSNVRLDGKGFAKRCAIDFCWFIRNRTISDLEAKLAESDAEIERFKEINAVQKNKIINIDKMYKQSQEEQKQLKQQLAEKDKQIEDAKDVSRRLIRICGEANCYGKNQTAIRELEKVKKFLLEKIAEKQSCFDSGNYNDFADGVKTICELMLISIDNQINWLKGD